MNEERSQRSEKIERMRIDQNTLIGPVDWIKLFTQSNWIVLIGSAD